MTLRDNEVMDGTECLANEARRTERVQVQILHNVGQYVLRQLAYSTPA
jgi:hypothetical protein